MIFYIVKRLSHAVVTLLVVLVGVFFLSRAIGDPARLIVGSEGSEEQYQAVREMYGFNDPLPVQFWHAFVGWFHGDFGMSFIQHRPAGDIVFERIPATAALAFAALGIAIPLAVIVGVLAARRPLSIVDRGLSALAISGISIPQFWLGLMLMLVLAVQLRWLPTSGFGPREVVLPAVALAFPAMGRIAQVTRNAMLDQLNQPYIVTAQSKGVGERKILLRHALRNASLPIVTMIGGTIIHLMSGAVIIEMIFGWPGLGQVVIKAINGRDLPVVSAAVFAIAVVVLVLNLLTDMTYARLDPRVRLSGGGSR